MHFSDRYAVVEVLSSVAPVLALMVFGVEIRLAFRVTALVMLVLMAKGLWHLESERALRHLQSMTQGRLK